MTILYNAERFAVPADHFTFFNSVASPNNVILVEAPLSPGGDALLLGVDVFNASFANGDDAQLQIFDPVTGGRAAFFRAFTYTQSQGYFSWRGEMMLFSGIQVLLSAFVGAWSATAWGLQIPIESDSP